MPYELVEIFMCLFVFLDAFNKPARGLSLLYSLYCEVSGEYMFIGTFQTFPFNSSGGKGIFFHANSNANANANETDLWP